MVRLTTRVRRAGLAGWLLGLLALAVYAPGLFALPMIDRDEARFAGASRAMLESGTLEGWMVPRLGGEPRLNKPPLTYWLQAGSARVLGRDEVGSYRVVSVVSAVASVVLTWRIGRRLVGERAGAIAGVLLAVCPVVAWEARQARADQVLLACTLVAMLGLVRLWRSGSRDRAGHALLWAGVTLGVLAKGPITPMVVGLAAAAISVARWRAGARPRVRWALGWWSVVGAATLTLAAGAWVWQVASSVGFEAYARVVVDETLGRSVRAREGHSGPPGYHLALLAALGWPGTMLAGLALARPVVRWRARRAGRGLGWARAGERVCWAWLLPSWLVFEIVGTKLPHYTLPLYPAVAMLAARALVDAERGALECVRTRLVRAALWAWWVIGGAWSAAVVVGPALLMESISVMEWVAIGGVGLASLAALAMTGRALARGRLGAAQAWSVACAGVVSIGGLGVLVPWADGAWITDRLWRAMEEVERSHGPGPMAMEAYAEESLVFASSGRVARVASVAEFLSAHQDGIGVVEADRVPEGARAAARVRGLHYTKGRWIDLAIVVRDGP